MRTLPGIVHPRHSVIAMINQQRTPIATINQQRTPSQIPCTQNCKPKSTI